MTGRVTQTILVGDPSGRLGNCLQAAVASLLDLPLDDVPHFAEFADWFGQMAEFACTYGFDVRWAASDGPAPQLGLAFGPSVRSAEISHAVAILDGETWDPHPTRAGLTSVTTYVRWEHAAGSQVGTQ